MKALVKSKREPGLWLEDVEKPKIGINDVLIRVHRTGICGTDLHIYQWDDWAQKTIPVPMVIGHEFVGEIAEVGSNVADFYPGDIVSGEGHVTCGRCRNCLAGRRHLCAHTQGVGVNRPGAFAEYIALPMTNIWRHSPSIDQGYRGHLRSLRQCRSHRAVVSGAGRGCADHRRRSDRPDGRRGGTARGRALRGDYRRQSVSARTGQEDGRDRGPESSKSARLPQVQKQLGMLEGFDVGLEMSGNGEALRDMLANMSHGAKIALLGIPKHESVVDLNPIIFKLLTIKGIYGREMYETWYKMTMMLQCGLDISPVITHRYSAEEFQKGFEAMHSGECAKVILSWN